MDEKKVRIELSEDCFRYGTNGQVVGLRYAGVVDFLKRSPYEACSIDGSPARRNLDNGLFLLGQTSLRSAVRECYPDVNENDLREITSFTTDVGLPSRQRSAATLLMFENGVLDVKKYASGEKDCLRECDETMCLTSKLPWNFNIDAACESVDKFLDDLSCGDVATRANLEETLALALYRDRSSLQIAPFLYGPTAANGKTTLLEVLYRVLGRDNCVSLLPDDLVHEYKSSKVVGKMLVAMNDVPSDAWRSPVCSALKTMIDGSLQMGNAKYRDPSPFRNQAVFVLTSNSLPRFPASESSGIMRRLRLVPMYGKFEPGTAGYDPGILEKVTTPEACEYWLLLAVNALIGLLERRDMTPNVEGQKLASVTVADNDAFLAWVEHEDINEGDLLNKVNNVVFGDYARWCLASNYRAGNINQFSRMVKTHFGLETGHKSIAGKNHRVYKKPSS